MRIQQHKSKSKPAHKTERVRTPADLSARQVALTVIDMVSQSDKDMAGDWLDGHFRRFSIPWRDRSLITEMVYGTIRRTITLDWLMSHYTFHRVKDHLLKNILRLGLYQIYFLDKVPSYAVVNEMVQITKDRMGEPKARFANAVLRRACARDIALDEKSIAKRPGMEALHALSIAYGMPQWLLERWQKVYTPEEVRQICAASNGTPQIFLRVNRRKTDGPDLKALLEKEGAQAEITGNQGILKIKPAKSIESLESFRNGLFFIQDPTTLRIVDFMQPSPTDVILDMCAAPGGKAFYLEERVGKGANITALEREPARLRLAMDNAQRLGSEVRWVGADALQYQTPGKFDKILVDAPCSNQGVLARRVEARLRLAPEKIERLRRIQKELLEKALELAGTNGEVYYSTCSIDYAENEGLIKEFLKNRKTWTCESKLTILPEAGNHDGGFVAKLVRCKKDGSPKS